MISNRGRDCRAIHRGVVQPRQQLRLRRNARPDDTRSSRHGYQEQFVVGTTADGRRTNIREGEKSCPTERSRTVSFE